VPHWQFYYHLVWATKYRELIIDDEMAGLIRHVVNDTCAQHQAIPHAIGFMPDHLHLAVSIPPKIAVADFIGQIKGLSSFRINKQGTNEERRGFRWQTEYGALTFGERSLATVVAYVENQATHHANQTLLPSFERLDTRPLVSSPNARQ
jgi:putative transposase